MQLTCSVSHAAPAGQPESADEVAERLLPAYRIEGGSIQLGQCRFEERLIVRVRFQSPRGQREVYVDDRGREVDLVLAAALAQRGSVPRNRPRLAGVENLDWLVGRGLRIARHRLADAEPLDLLAVRCLWCVFVEGVLDVRIGQRSLQTAFADWGFLLRAPALICPCTGQRTFHLAATDDGRMAAASEIEACAETGCRVLREELATCEVTGRRVLPELLAQCPITGQRLLRAELRTCRLCSQKVSPAALEAQSCAACRNLEPVRKDDPRLVRLLDEYPALDRWSGWHMAEAAAVYVLTARRWLRRMLIVADKETLELKQLAAGTRLGSSWVPVEPSRFQAFLRD